MIAGLGAVGACRGFFDVSDPTLIRDQDIQNADGANGRRAVVYAFFQAKIPLSIRDVALFTDELSFDQQPQFANPSNEMMLDSRNSEGYEALHQGDDPHLGNLGFLVTYTSLAIPPVREFTPSPLKGDYLAQLFSYRGYAILQMAEDLCPGFPINDVTPDHLAIFSDPYTTDSAVSTAIAALDSAIAEVKDSTAYGNLARVLKGRALLDLAQYSEAAAAVASVPDDFLYTTDPTYGNTIFNMDDDGNPDWPSQAFPVGNGEWGTGLDFVSEHDSVRVPTIYRRRGFSDTTIAEYAQAKYGPTTQFIVAGGIEARLIEAEVALHGGDPNWLAILNALRTPTGLDSLHDPGTPDARVDLLFHERAFWLYLTGHRLGDLRRLIRNYGRTASSVFPPGNNPFIAVAPYGTATAIPFSLAHESQYNHHITGGCTTR